MNHKGFTGWLLLSVILFNGCTSIKLMNTQLNHEKELKRLVHSDLEIEEKVNQFSRLLNDVIQESMEYSSNRNTYKHIQHFTKRNKSTISMLIEQIENEMSSMNPIQKVQFSFRLLKQPYTKSLIELVPKVEKKINRKIRQIHLIGKFISVLKPNLF